MDLIAQLAHELNLKAANIEAAVKLSDEGTTRRAPVLPAQS